MNTLPHVSRSRFVRSAVLGFLGLFLSASGIWAAVSLSTSVAYVQGFDSMGIPATSTTATALPANFKVDNPATARTLGTYAAALSTVARAGGASLSTTASNGIYNFGAGTASLGGSDRAVGFLSSGSATGSGNLYTQLTNTTGSALSSLKISYTVEKYRGGTNAAGFRIQLFYSTDGATWTSAGSDFLTSFTADASNNGFAIAPGASVAVNSTLAVNIPDGSNFYLAWNYSVASGTITTNAQALAIDDISILGVGNGPTNPAATGAATPASVAAGSSTLLTVNVTPGTNPASTGLAVTGDLSSIGGSATQQFYDDGTHGDVTAGDNVFSFSATVTSATSAGGKTLPIDVTDTNTPPRSASTSIALTVTPASLPPSGTGAATPANLQAGNNTLLTVAATAGTNPADTAFTVSGNLSSIGGSSTQPFYDDGTHGDVTAGDNVFSFQAAVGSGVSAGTKSLPITVTDGLARTGSLSISLTVQPPPPPTTVKISQVYGGGGNSGSTYTNDFIEVFNQGTTAVDLAGWSVQYVSAAATGTWQVTPLCASTCLLQPGHYFLVQESQGSGGTTSLPAADATGTIAMSANNANVALVASTVPLTAGCHSGGFVVDAVAYGTGVCPETSATAALVATTASIRRGNGCTDTDNNHNDFVTDGPIPRNTSSPAQTCGGDPSQLSGLGIAKPGSLLPASNTLLTVAVTPATTPASTNVVVTGDLTNVGGTDHQQFYDDGTHGDVTAGDRTYSLETTVGATLSTGAKSIPVTISDDQGRTVSAPITLTIQSPSCGVERWSVKVGTDPDAAQVDLNNPVRAKIAELGALPAPSSPPDNSRYNDTEKTVFVINANMTFYKFEDDVDYHVVIQDDAGHTMVVEIPSPACLLLPTSPRTQGTSPFADGISKSRQNFDSHLTAQSNFQVANVPVQIKGVGFFDFIHGQTGVSPNGIELHPVLEINFTVPTTTTLNASPNPSQYGQSVSFTAVVANDGSSTPTGDVTLFDGTTAVATAALDSNGQVTFSVSSLAVGTHSLTASYEGDSKSAQSVSAPYSQTVNKADQTITFGTLAGKTFGDSDFTVSATASSTLPVSFKIESGPATMSGTLVHITGAGSVTVRASQAGNGNYNPAPDVDQVFVVSPASQTINFAALSGKTYGDASFTVSATGGPSTSPVTFSSAGDCTSSGTNGSTITITSAGSCTVTASQAADANYNAAADVPRTFAIEKATAAFSGLSSPTIVTGTASTTLSGKIALGALVPSGSVAITLNGVTQNAAIQSDGTFSSTFATASLTPVAGGYSIAYSYAGDTNFNPASGTGTLTVNFGVAPLYDMTKAAQAGSTIPIRLQLTNSSGGNVSSAGVIVTAIKLTLLSTNASSAVQDSGNANPDGNFRFDGLAYIFNLSTKGLASGTYSLEFRVSGETTTHTVTFQVR